MYPEFPAKGSMNDSVPYRYDPAPWQIRQPLAPSAVYLKTILWTGNQAVTAVGKTLILLSSVVSLIFLTTESMRRGRHSRHFTLACPWPRCAFSVHKSDTFPQWCFSRKENEHKTTRQINKRKYMHKYKPTFRFSLYQPAIGLGYLCRKPNWSSHK